MSSTHGNLLELQRRGSLRWKVFSLSTAWAAANDGQRQNESEAAQMHYLPSCIKEWILGFEGEYLTTFKPN